ncbi:MAG: hypothetical protein P1V81_01035 [Planctomycetota bacterium]|nr:hypothetical protein [Planctomycetota bacterium]
MSTSPHNCESFREEHLLASSRTAEAPACGDCRGWIRRSDLQLGLLGSLERHPAPLALDAALADALEVGAAGQEALLRGLERQSAPPALGARLAAELAADPRPSWAGIVGSLAPKAAPSVLDRLVDEELSDPEAAVTRRFVGGLFRARGPRGLADRIERDLRPSRLGGRRLTLSLGGLAAAVLLVWGVTPLLDGSPTEQRLSFTVVQVTNLDDLDPFARSLVEGLAGGRVNPVQPASDQPPGSVNDGGGR